MKDVPQLLAHCGMSAAAARLRLFATSACYACILEPFGRSSHVIALSCEIVLVPTFAMLCGPKRMREARRGRTGRAERLRSTFGEMDRAYLKHILSAVAPHIRT